MGSMGATELTHSNREYNSRVLLYKIMLAFAFNSKAYITVVYMCCKCLSLSLL